jgi:hypothetical protein
LSMVALAVSLAAPVSAQSATLRASVPFDFIVGGRTMPAGDYLVGASGSSAIVQVRNTSKDIAPAVAMSNVVSGSQDSEVFLRFRRYGGDYFLAELWDGVTAAGRSIPTSRIEQEKANSASIGKPELVMVLARR